MKEWLMFADEFPREGEVRLSRQVRMDGNVKVGIRQGQAPHLRDAIVQECPRLRCSSSAALNL